ncbi:alpha/beta hydrolase [Actinomadura algeriensis]|uniref:S-formylglutathione hydrolase FrmB n=1 Tax=Actinomadura algeriensis TaxID=1679523 RepID=A0ABR9JPW9_9ACTN|nr:alpha/beta hydrolase-fold protein [Actinomadura algeriensis]MBE1532577.1 S-formylglutathione hydrolase FrmB [Actinomadura algeriensis]
MSLPTRAHARRRLAIVALLTVMHVLSPVPATAQTFAPADTGARITDQTWLDDRTFDVTIDAPGLPEQVKTRVIVPAGWTPDADRAWPVVYAYHGGRDNYVSWTRSTDIERYAASHDVMVVMPEAANGAYTDWYNDGEGGPPMWETFHTTEVVQLMERNFHAGTTRAAMGISSGASGAMAYAARHPGIFEYVAASSGVMHMTMPGIPTMLVLTQALYTETEDATDVWGVPGIDAENWLAHDPWVLARNLRGVGLFVSSGTTGLPGPHDRPAPGEEESVQVHEVTCGRTTESFLRRLDALDIPVTSHVYEDGWHNWEAWRPEMDRYWEPMMAAIGA